MSEVKQKFISREQVAQMNETHGWFEFADAQSGVSNAFANEAIERYERIRVAAPRMLEFLEREYTRLGDYTNEWPGRHLPESQRMLSEMRDLIALATGREERDVQDDYGCRVARAKASGARP